MRDSLTYLWASAPPEEMQMSRKTPLIKTNGCMSVTVSRPSALFPTRLTFVPCVSSDCFCLGVGVGGMEGEWGGGVLELNEVLRKQQVSVES